MGRAEVLIGTLGLGFEGRSCAACAARLAPLVLLGYEPVRDFGTPRANREASGPGPVPQCGQLAPSHYLGLLLRLFSASHIAHTRVPGGGVGGPGFHLPE
jgi:hypothetical protein